MPTGTRRRSTVRTTAIVAVAGLSLTLGISTGGAGASPGAGAAAAKPKGKLLFSSNRNPPNASYEIYVQDQNGGAAVDLTNSNNTVSDYDPAWSPDGKKIIWTSADPSDQDIWIMNADGSGKVPLTVNTDGDNNAAFSPDGRKIAFASNRGTGFYDIYVMDANGGNPVRITFGTSGATENFGPDWSPDGQRIVFMSKRDGGDNDVFAMNPDGSNVTQLTVNNVPDRAPKYSPDGKLIVWSQELGTTPNNNQDDAELFTMPAAGGTATRLTTNTVSDRAGSYTRDGLARIFFVRRDVVLDDEVYVMNGNGSSQVLFAGSPSSDIAPAPEPIASCQKKKATIIGTSASETLVGGPGPDVFSGQGGKDKIKGKGGKDTICGDAGKDNLNGGKGKDFLSGGKGKDKVVGGKGKDRCVGGKGNDSGKGCEKEKSL